MEWRHSGSPRPRPKKFRVQKSAGKVLATISWDHDDILHIDYLPKVQTNQSGVLLIPVGAIEGHFEGKKAWVYHQGGFVARKCPGSLGTCNPEETGLPGLPVS